MPLEPHKLDLPRADCVSFVVYLALPPDSEHLASIDDLLVDGVAGAGYSRSRTQHLTIVRRAGGESAESDVTFSIQYYAFGESPPANVGDVWQAIDLLYAAVGTGLTIRLVAIFSLPAADHTSKMRLPLTPFGEGLLPFDEIRGYRAVRVVDDHVLWTAIIDWPKPDDDYSIAVTIEQEQVSAGDPTHRLLDRCIDIRQSLMAPKGT